MNDYLIWFIVAILLFLSELIAPGVVLLFFGIGALIVALLTAIIDIPLTYQLIIFTLSSFISLFTLRSKFKNTFFGNIKIYNTNDQYIGKIVEVKKTIEPNSKGKIELNGTQWNAISEEQLEIGEKVIIIDRKNLTLKVSKTDF